MDNAACRLAAERDKFAMQSLHYEDRAMRAEKSITEMAAMLDMVCRHYREFGAEFGMDETIQSAEALLTRIRK